MTTPFDEDVQNNAPTPGAILSAERQRQGLSMGEVATQLRLTDKQVEAIELDHYELLPGKVFVRGFVRNYAKLLRIDHEPLVAACDELLDLRMRSVQDDTSPKVRVLPSAGLPSYGAPKKIRFPYAVLSLVAVAAAGWFGYQVLFQPAQAPDISALNINKHNLPPVTGVTVPQGITTAPVVSDSAAVQPGTTAIEPVQPQITMTPEIAAASAPAGALGSAPAGAASPAPATSPAPDSNAAAPESKTSQIHLVFQEDAWVEIRERGGKKAFAKFNKAGTQAEVEGTPPFSLIVGNADGVKVTYNDKPVNLASHTKVNVARLTLE